MLIEDFDIYNRRSNQSHQCVHCYTQELLPYWANFNSWGFRGPEYTDLVGKPVNICLGDSFTVNQGDDVENSWASQLAEHLDTPTINLAVDGAGNDTIRIIHDRAQQIFDVQTVFVMYSYFFRRLDNGVLTTHRDIPIKENIEFFLDNYIKHAHYTFIPEWCWRKEEVDYLKQEHNDHLPDCYVHWELPLTAKIKHRIFHLRDNKVDVFNQDLHHMNKARNQKIAEYFLEKYNG